MSYNQVDEVVKTSTSFYSNANSRGGLSQSHSGMVEQSKVEKEFRNTSTKIRDDKLNTKIVNVQDSGLDYTMVNLTTIDKIDEELMYKPILNVSVIGRLDNLKVTF